MRSPKLEEARREAIKALKELARKLNATIYLFGSYARGNHTLESDVDVVIVAQAFKGLSYEKRVEMVRTMLPPHIGFDIIPLTPEELKEKLNRSFFKEISKQWIRIED